jgi:ribosomal protein S12 methylthiotransferase
VPAYYLLSLGCAKNTVDSEGMAQLLTRAGFQSTDDPAAADLLIVNTCGFIAPARQESLDTLCNLASTKRSDQRLIAAGCWAQMEGSRLPILVPGIDGVLGTRRWMDLPDVLNRLARQTNRPLIHVPAEPMSLDPDVTGLRCAAVQGASAYIKIADGCRRPCAFCTIPRIKGTSVSRPVHRVVADAVDLAAQGIKEIILVAQDTTDYGADRGEVDGLAELLQQLVVAAPQVPWIRIMYAFPGSVTPRLIETMARTPQVLHYLDIPLQHAHPAVLRRMRRPSNVGWVRQTVARMRSLMPDLAIRTTFIVGYPGETADQFQALMDLLEEMRFDRVGAFRFWPEPDTVAADLPAQVPAEIKAERLDRLMTLQQQISLERNREHVGRTLDVLVEGYQEGLAIGRSYRDAPEIDGLVLLQERAPLGSLVPVRITGALAYDLIGERVQGDAQPPLNTSRLVRA